MGGLQNHISVFFRDIRNRNKVSKFLLEYISRDTVAIDRFFALLTKFWPNFVEWVIDVYEDGFHRDQVLYRYLTSVPVSDLSIQSKSKLSKYLSELKFLSIWAVGRLNADQFETIINNLDIVFENLEVDRSGNQEWYYKVIDNQRFRLSLKTFLGYAALECDRYQVSSSKLESSCYTTVLKLPEHSILRKHVDADIENFVENVLLKLGGNNAESEKTLLRLVNIEALKAHIPDFFKQTGTRITELADVIEVAWEDVLEAEGCKPSWDNVIFYYCNAGEKPKIDSVLAEFVNNFYKLIAQTEIRNDYKNIVAQFFQKMLSDEAVFDLDVLEELVSFIPNKYDHIDELNDISYERLRLLIENDLIEISHVSVVSALVARDDESIVDLLKRVDDWPIYTVPELSEVNKNDLLKFDRLSDEKRILILAELTLESFADNSLNQQVVDLICKTNYQVGEVDKVLKIAESEIGIKKKVQFLTTQISWMTIQDVYSFFVEIGAPYNQILIKSPKSTQVDNNCENHELLGQLFNRGWITSFKVSRVSKKYLARAKGGLNLQS